MSYDILLDIPSFNIRGATRSLYRLFVCVDAFTLPHDTEALDDVQCSFQVEESGVLTTLHVANLTAPAWSGDRPLVPEADNERVARRIWGG